MDDRLEVIYEAALDAIRRGEPAAMVTVIQTHGSTPRQTGAKMLICAGGRTVGTVGGGPLEAWVIEQGQEALAEGRSRLLQRRLEENAQDVCGGDMHLFVEVLLPRPTLLVIGAGHIGQAVAAIGAQLGYRIAVLDERPELVTVERFPEADVLLYGPFDEELERFPLTEHTYVVIVTPHHSLDEKALAVTAKRPVPYVGLLGSHRRTKATFERAREMGVPHAFLERIHTPVGVDIAAETPREIAVSILAEVIAARRRED
ncbi:MAG: XdhC/CoxI family protein [Anaerolineae bacterium]|jgi:xanthine dehydrogenase accessory factor